MAQGAWKHGLWLGFLGFALASGCVVKTTSDDDDITGGAAGEAGDDSGGSGGRGGSSGSSTGGSSTGGSSTGGSSTGGTSSGGTSTGGTSTGGTSTGGSATGGIGGNDTEYECDPPSGELDSTPYPDCEPDPENDVWEPECEPCIKANCCEESRVCYGFNPGNVCGWGGPEGMGYAGEIDCYVQCAMDYVAENGAYDDGAQDRCYAECATDGPGEDCGLIGNATQDLILCMEENCDAECWPAE